MPQRPRPDARRMRSSGSTAPLTPASTGPARAPQRRACAWARTGRETAHAQGQARRVVRGRERRFRPASRRRPGVPRARSMRAGGRSARRRAAGRERAGRTRAGSGGGEGVAQAQCSFSAECCEGGSDGGRHLGGAVPGTAGSGARRRTLS